MNTIVVVETHLKILQFKEFQTTSTSNIRLVQGLNQVIRVIIHLEWLQELLQLAQNKSTVALIEVLDLMKVKVR